jgi:UDP-glucose 4-epimerase
MTNVLVTGGAGFIGSHIVDALINKRYHVFVVDDLSSGRRENINKKAKFIKLDVRDKRLAVIFKKITPQFVFHLAAQKSVSKSVADPSADADINILGSINLFENCRSHKVKKIIFSSTGGAIYGDTSTIPTSENQVEMPVSPYGVAKLSIEKYLYYYKMVFGLPYVILRYANVYGPRQDPEGEAGVVAIFLDKILTHQQPFINGHGRQTRDYVYVSDVVRANILAMQQGVTGAFNIGTAKETSVNDLYGHIHDIANTTFRAKHRKGLLGEQQRSCLSFLKYKKFSGWKPEISLARGLRITHEWFEDKYR